MNGMINPGLLNVDFKQKGSICVISSYSIIIEYFSNREMPINEVISNFENFFPNLKQKISDRLLHVNVDEREAERENMIYDAFKNYCQEDGDKRGFDLIKEIHNADKLKTESYCKVIKSNAQKDKPIDEKEIAELIELIKSGGLAMVLYPVPSGSHSIVIGFNEKIDKFFKRDPFTQEITYVDFLQTNSIFEYIYFKQ